MCASTYFAFPVQTLKDRMSVSGLSTLISFGVLNNNCDFKLKKVLIQSNHSNTSNVQFINLTLDGSIYCSSHLSTSVVQLLHEILEIMFTDKTKHKQCRCSSSL